MPTNATEQLKDRRAQRQAYIHRIETLETKLKAVEQQIAELTNQAKNEAK